MFQNQNDKKLLGISATKPTSQTDSELPINCIKTPLYNITSTCTYGDELWDSSKLAITFPIQSI